MKANSALVILSGGQDSVTCLYWALERFPRVEALSFDYGQRHAVELEGAAAICREVGIVHHVSDVKVLAELAPSALTDPSQKVTLTGGLNGLPSTFVPARNAVFLTLGAAYAIPRGMNHLVIGACEADSSGYPDCREEFLASQEKTLSLALGNSLQIHRPLVNMTKADIFALADALNRLPDIVEKTHTCYEGVRDTLHPWGYGCGVCPACTLRKRGFEAFEQNKLRSEHNGTSRRQENTL